jgi:multiple sugar transport system substrate-binding protein
MRWLLALLVLSGGCASPERGEVLRLSNWGGVADDDAQSRATRKLYQEFENDHPGTTVRVEGAPSEYVQKMILNFVAGAGPDVMAVDASSAAVFINSGTLRDLTPFIRADASFNASHYWPNVMDIGAKDQRLYTIPGDFTPMVLYYNKRLFDKAGVPYPKGVMTYGEFLEVCKRLTLEDINGNVTQYGFKFSNWMPMWILFLWNNGGDVLSPDGTKCVGYLESVANVEAVSFVRDLIKKHQVAPDLSQAAATGVDAFANGTAAMMISGHWEIPGFSSAPKIKPGDLGVVPVPSNLANPVTVMYEVGFGIPVQAKNPELAWKFVKYMTSEPFQRVYQAPGISVSGRRDVATTMAEGSGDRASLDRAFLKIVPTARKPWGTRVVGYDFIEQEGVKMMQSVLLGTPPKEALSQMASRVDAYFKVR